MADIINTTPAESQAVTAEPTQQTTQSPTQPAPPASADDKQFSQADVDRIVRERLARQKAPQADEQRTQSTVRTADDGLKSQVQALQNTLVGSEIKAGLSIAGVTPERVERAARLIDAAKCRDDNGQPDPTKINAEIAALLVDFPELKPEAGQVGFRIGADGTKQSAVNNQDTISAIFGNKKG